jgi:predicted ATP-binding protein involved in virulence
MELNNFSKESAYNYNSKKPSLFERLQKSAFNFLRIKPEIYAIVSDEDKSNLRLLVAFNLILAFFVLISVIFAASFFFPTNTWISILLLYVFFFLYLFLVSNSILKHRDTAYGGIKRWFVYLFLLVSVFGLSISLSSDLVHEAYKADKYKQQNALYARFVNRLNSQTSQISYNQNLKLANRLAGSVSKDDRSFAREIFIDSLNERIGDDRYQLRLLNIKKNGFNDSVSIRDDSLTSTGITYPVCDLTGFVSRNDTLYEYAGIQFYQGNSNRELVIAQNLNDSIYNLLQHLQFSLFLSAAVKGKTDSSTRNYQVGDDSQITADVYKDANKNWLKNIMSIENGPDSKRGLIYWYFILLGKANNGVFYKTMILFLLVSLMYFYVIHLSTRIANSSYPVLVELYKSDQSKQLEVIRERLQEKKAALETYYPNQQNVFSRKIDLARSLKGDPLDDYIAIAQKYLDENQYEVAVLRLEEGYNMYRYSPSYRKRAVELLKDIAQIYLAYDNKAAYQNRMEEYDLAYNYISAEENLYKDISIDKLEVSGHHFYDEINWKLKPGINVLLGKNGYGKSHLLSIMLSILQHNFRKACELVFSTAMPDTKQNPIFTIRMTEPLQPELSEQEKKTLDGMAEKVRSKITADYAEDIEKSSEEEKKHFEKVVEEAVRNEREHLIKQMNSEKWTIQLLRNEIKGNYGKIPVLAIPDTRLIDKSGSSIKRADDNTDIRVDGAWHFIYQAPYSSIIENFFHDVCSELYEKQSLPPSMNIEPYSVKLIKDVYSKLTGNTINTVNVTKKGPSLFEMTVSTDEVMDELPIQKVSQGTFSIVSMVGVIYTYLKMIYEGRVSEEDYAKQKGIVIVDEIDAHLHPSWQQKLLNIFRSTFPQVQFIITAHSPFIVAGCSEMEVSVLRRSETSGKFALTQFNQDFIGYSPDELCKQVFNIEKYDENYITFINQTPRKKDIEEEIKRLKVNPKPNKEEVSRLNELYYEQYRIMKAEIKFKERSTDVKSQNLLL